MKKLPLRVDKATALLWPQVGVQWDGDSQEGILVEDPRDGVIVKEVDPASVTRDGSSEVL